MTATLDMLEDSLERLMELAQHALPEDRLRLERTMVVVERAWQTIQQAHRVEQQAWDRLV
jgi:hypothetical protein